MMILYGCQIIHVIYILSEKIYIIKGRILHTVKQEKIFPERRQT